MQTSAIYTKDILTHHNAFPHITNTTLIEESHFTIGIQHNEIHIQTYHYNLDDTIYRNEVVSDVHQAEEFALNKLKEHLQLIFPSYKIIEE